MGIEIIVSVVGIVIATAVSVWTYRRTHPKRQLRYRVEITPLVASGAERSRLTITLDGQIVTDPQLVTLSLWSTGRADISSTAFDAGTPLTFDLGAPVIEEAPSEAAAIPRLEVGPSGSILLRPRASSSEVSVHDPRNR